ncbi:sodium:proton antiporter [Alicyclobacillaceae bacterium I2511]|nr:sodium:proton antiporter [Alicyclobacillaceae bacterium I2511]
MISTGSSSEVNRTVCTSIPLFRQVLRVSWLWYTLFGRKGTSYFVWAVMIGGSSLNINSWETTMMILLWVLVGGLLLGKLAEKLHIPDVVAFLILGIIMGPSILHWISVPLMSQVNQFILEFGAMLILFDGGRGIQFSVLRQVWLSIVLLATLGVFITVAVVAGAAHWAFGMPWILGLLTASVVASTDPATLIPVFKQVPVLKKLQVTAEAESAFNDAVGSILVMVLLAAGSGKTRVSMLNLASSFAQSAGMGLVCGGVIGLLGLYLVSYKGWGVFHEFGSLIMLAVALGSFQLAENLHGSGFMAAFVAGLVVGNGNTFHFPLAEHTQANIRHFFNAITLLMRMLIFEFLGSQVNFSLIAQYIWMGLGLTLVLMLIARPATVLVSTWLDKRAQWRWRELLLLFWVRETGVIPAVLTGVVAATGISGASQLAAVTFLTIFMTIGVQATSTRMVARKLGVLEGQGLAVEDV